ncbi:MAG: glutamine synthetase family protein [Bacteroidales bacterium]
MNTTPIKNINPLVSFFEKSPSEFTKNDIMRYVAENDIRIINFRYAGNDGRLKTLNLPILSEQYLDTILTYGERVDGSSLFPYIEAGSSDLYVIPKFRTAYVDPFSEIPTLGLLCSFFTKDGLPLECSPEYTLQKAQKAFQKATGYTFEAMGELEFYVIAEDEPLFMIPDQKGYHESEPFSKFGQFRCEAMDLIAKAGGQIKYAHSEVGNFRQDGKIYEQNEIEFLVNPAETAADQLLIAKWILRTLAYQYGYDITFAAKITTGKAGSGLHFHTRIVKGDKSLMIENGVLSDVARKAIAGYMTCASSITAFGNTNPCSYFRLVPHQEAPTTICWGDRNRSVLVRVPLGWTGKNNMLQLANPLEKEKLNIPDKQTVELRSPDGSADIYLTIAGLIVAARIGMQKENALEIANRCYVDVNIHNEENKEKMMALEQLPSSCYESALCLEKNRALYEAEDVFSPILIDGIIKQLKAFNDQHIRLEAAKDQNKMQALVNEYYYCG